eukprot:757155-Hanusia_phi.AAC.3
MQRPSRFGLLERRSDDSVRLDDAMAANLDLRQVASEDRVGFYHCLTRHVVSRAVAGTGQPLLLNLCFELHRDMISG